MSLTDRAKADLMGLEDYAKPPEWATGTRALEY